MSVTARDNDRGVDASAEESHEAVFERFAAFFKAQCRVQDALRAWIANNCLLAMTMLARPNRLNSCASFLASPL